MVITGTEGQFFSNYFILKCLYRDKQMSVLKSCTKRRKFVFHNRLLFLKRFEFSLHKEFQCDSGMTPFPNMIYFDHYEDSKDRLTGVLKHS